jgi:hypothetical protein
MRKELDDALCADYPEIFRDRRAPMNQTLMCWGFACGDGWYPLIDKLCKHLMWSVTQARDNVRRAEAVVASPDTASDFERNFYTPEQLAEYRAILAEHETRIPIAVQVKEKLGTLRFYVTHSTDEQNAIISFAESLSGRICEVCGAMRDTKTYREGWHRTLCPDCNAERHDMRDDATESD